MPDKKYDTTQGHGAGWQSQCTVNIGGGPSTVYIGTPTDYQKHYGGEVYGASRGISEQSELGSVIWTQVKIKNPRRFHRLFPHSNFKEDYRVLKAEVSKTGVNIPPLVNTYMNMSQSMIYFGTGINDEFADVLDSGMLVAFDDIYPEKMDRHVNSFRKIGFQAIRSLLRRFQRKR